MAKSKWGRSPIDKPVVERQREERERRETQVQGMTVDYVVVDDPVNEAPRVDAWERVYDHYMRVNGPLVFQPNRAERRRDPVAEQKRIQEAERLRKEADARAEQLLREAGSDGVRLADGEAVLISSPSCEEITYGITAKRHGMVYVFHSRLGCLGNVCVQPQHEAPLADELLTRLMLCRGNEKQLWEVGNYNGNVPTDFLPQPLRSWVKPPVERAVFPFWGARAVWA